MSAKRAHVYPQVDPGAAGLIECPIARVARRSTIEAALAAARKRDAGVVQTPDGRFVLRADLARAESLGLNELPSAALSRSLPAVDARASEIAVRRGLAAGAPFVIVRDRRGPVGAVSRRGLALDALPGFSMASAFGRALSAEAKMVLGTVARLAGEGGARVYLVGGLVRDALLAGQLDGRDLDVVVDGDGLAVARALGTELGGNVVAHERFLTASVVLASGARIDIATSRAERYETPGALPRVMPAGIADDLGRRDFTINAMAVELASGRFELLDPFGGRADLSRRRLVALHPLAFVEDPTRIFRGARYAARLGLRLDAWTARALALALRLGSYPALAGQRLAAELERIAGEARADVALSRLAVAGAFRLLDRRYRFTRATAGRLRALPAALEWVRARALEVSGFELTSVAVLADQPTGAAVAALRRLAASGEPLARLERALGTLRDARGHAVPAGRPSDRARWLRGRTDVELATLWLAGDASTRSALDWFVGAARDVRPALRGDDLLALGVPGGPEVARVLDELRDGRLDGALEDRAAELARVRQRFRAEPSLPEEGRGGP